MKILTDLSRAESVSPATSGFISWPKVNVIESDTDALWRTELKVSDRVNTTRYLLFVRTLIISALPVEFIFLVHVKSGEIYSIVQLAFSRVVSISTQQNPMEVKLGNVNPFPMARIMYLTLFLTLFLNSTVSLTSFQLPIPTLTSKFDCWLKYLFVKS